MLRPPGNRRRCSYQRACLCQMIRCVSGCGRVSLHVLACVHACDTDCALTCGSPRLQSLFHVTDVFLPPDYVANLQKVTDPTLTCAVAPALSTLTLLPSFSLPLPTSQCDIPQYPVPLAPLRGSLPPDHHAHPPVEHPTALLGGRARGLGRGPSLPRWNRTNPYPAHRMSLLSAGR